MDSGAKHSASPSASDSVCVQHSQQIHHACGRDEARAVVSRGPRNVWAGGLKEARQKIERTRTRICEEPERTEWIARVRRKHLAAHSIPRHGQTACRQEKEKRAAPAAQQQ